jgi:hypothetical protein
MAVDHYRQLRLVADVREARVVHAEVHRLGG